MFRMASELINKEIVSWNFISIRLFSGFMTQPQSLSQFIKVKPNENSFCISSILSKKSSSSYTIKYIELVEKQVLWTLSKCNFFGPKIKLKRPFIFPFDINLLIQILYQLYICCTLFSEWSVLYHILSIFIVVIMYNPFSTFIQEKTKQLINIFYSYSNLMMNTADKGIVDKWIHLDICRYVKFKHYLA